jgi:hypothetical protein
MAEAPISLADDLLPACTVRIDLGERPHATGFFVAPGLVMTAAFVLPDEGAKVEQPPLSMFYAGHRYEPLSTLLLEGGALALVDFAAPAGHPCVLLDEQVRAADPLHAFGFPQTHPEGAPTSLVAEGFTGDRRLVGLTGNAIYPGTSGAPVLNLRTGCVCGLVVRTRGEDSPLGGYMSPLTALDQFGDLREANRGFHERDARWLDALTDEQRSALDVSPETESSTSTDDDDDDEAADPVLAERVDWVPDAPADLDGLDRDHLARDFARRLLGLLKSDPGRSFLVHIDGPWGSGKTTLAELVLSRVGPEPAGGALPGGPLRRLAPGARRAAVVGTAHRSP